MVIHHQLITAVDTTHECQQVVPVLVFGGGKGTVPRFAQINSKITFIQAVKCQACPFMVF